MDTTAQSINPEHRKSSVAGVSLALFFAFSALLLALGMKYSQSCGTLNGLSFYGRYDGLAGGITEHFAAVVKCSATCLAELFILYFLSFSTVFLPAVLTILGIRGFIAGIAVSAANSAATLFQLTLYVAVTCVICIFASLLLRCKKSEENTDSRVFARTAYLFVTAGGCVTLELALSYIV